MGNLIMASIMTLMLSSMFGPARAATLLVSNQMQTRRNVPVFVTCNTNTELSKSIPWGQKLSIEIPGTGGDNAINGKPAYWISCYGTYYRKANFGRFETPYVLYNSVYDATECKNVCQIVIKDDGFYRWNSGKKSWDKITPIHWLI